MSNSGLVFACVVPHGTMVVPAVSDEAGKAAVLREALMEVRRRCEAADPEVLVIATPHGVRVEGTICLAAVARGTGTLRYQGREVDMNIPVDLPLTDAIAERAESHDVPIALAGFAGNRRDQSAIPLDWGVMTPMWFLGHNHYTVRQSDALTEPQETDSPTAVIVAPSRQLPRSAMVEFGKAMAEAAAASGRRVGYVASCDWGHRHQESGPYGYHPAAAEVDAKVVQALKDNDPGQLIDLTDQEVQDAAIDGLWQTLMLAGAMEVTPLKGEFLAYEVPSYFGMMVAAWAP